MSRGWHGPHTSQIGPTTAWEEKAARIRAMRAEGRTLASIGAELGISRQRVHQLINRAPDGRKYRFDRGYAPTTRHHRIEP